MSGAGWGLGPEDAARLREATRRGPVAVERLVARMLEQARAAGMAECLAAVRELESELDAEHQEVPEQARAVVRGLAVVVQGAGEAAEAAVEAAVEAQAAL